MISAEYSISRIQFPTNQLVDGLWLIRSGTTNCASTFQREVFKPVSRARPIASAVGQLRNHICEGMHYVAETTTCWSEGSIEWSSLPENPALRNIRFSSEKV